MLRISLAALGIYFLTLTGFSQTQDSSRYKTRRLSFEEANFVSAYYHQEGNNSAVTGGIGTEKLTDFATTIDVRFSRYNRKTKKQTITGELGFDVYSSASSDKIDPFTISSASSMDTRFYPSITWAVTDEEKRSTVSINGSVSAEYDYLSKGAGIGWSKVSKDNNRELSAKANVFLDTWSVILPIELRASSEKKGTEPRNSYNAAFALSQVISKRLQILLLADVAYQQGQLATLYHRTYFTDGTHRFEKLPATRFKIPVGMRLNYFLGDHLILRAHYRYYRDDWNLTAHTFEMEMPVKITPFLSLSPFYRYYTQQGARYFNVYGQHQSDAAFYTSDYDLSTLTSNMTGMGIRYAPPGGVMGISKLNAVELRYAHYQRSTGLVANIITVFAKFK